VARVLDRTAILPTSPPASDPTNEQWSRHRRLIVAAVLTSLVLAALTLVVAFYETSHRRTNTAARTPIRSHVPSTLPSSSTATITSPANTVAPQPQTIQQLVALLSAHPDAFGSKAHDLRDQLQHVLTKLPRPARKDITHLGNDINHWISRGQLDPTIGAAAIHLLNNPAMSSR
jgi:hypothetical protein